MQVAAELLPRFADGAWFCELAAASNADEMAQVVAIALGVAQRQGMTLAGSIVDLLRTRQILVVLDNCEHLLDAAAQLAEAILTGAPGVRILATSREGLGIPGEHIWPLRSLPLPSNGDAAASDAVVLFADRAQAADPGFVLGEANTPAVVEVCRRLDGIPLAIELAAARVSVMSPAEIAGHLDERFRLLTAGRRGRVERHQTLRAAVEWSYSLLTDFDRAVFDRLGVFPASFDEAAAIAVCGGDGIERWDVIDALSSLVAKSMVGLERSGDATRYQLLETLRHFARGRAGDDLEEQRRRHAAYYATFIERAGAGVMSPDELLWRPRVTAELDNCRAATGWAVKAHRLDDVSLGVRVLNGYLSVVAGQPTGAVLGSAAAALAGVEELDPAQRSVVLGAAALDAFYVGDLDRARELGGRALAASEGFTLGRMTALSAVSMSMVAAGDAEGAMAVVAEARQQPLTATSTDDVGSNIPLPASVIAELIGGLTFWIAHTVGDHALARSQSQQLLASARRDGSPSTLAMALMTHARTVSRENPDQALADAQECVTLVEAGAATGSYTPALQTAALIQASRADGAGAARSIQTAVEFEHRDGNLLMLAAAFPIAVIVLAGDPDGFTAAAALGAAVNGPVLAHLPVFLGGDHRDRYEQSLGANAYSKAQQQGAVMTYDEIIAFTLSELARMADTSSKPAATEH